MTRKQWVKAGDLVDAEQLLGAGTGRVTVKGARSGSVSPPGDLEVVYNLTVAGPHTYRVGAVDVLVHNTGCELDSNGWPKKNVPNATNCLDCTKVIQNKIGGKIVIINRANPTVDPDFGPSRNNPDPSFTAGTFYWDHPYMVRKNGRLYDAYTGEDGIPDNMGSLEKHIGADASVRFVIE